MKRHLFAVLGLVAIVAMPVLAIAAGIFDQYPTVGGAAGCMNFATNPVTGAVLTTCNGPAIPAGPTALTGSETVPADTNLASGQNPQTVQIPMAALNAMPFTFSTLGPTTATNVLTATNLNSGIVVVGSAALSPTTIYLPPSPMDGQQFAITSTQTIATLTLATPLSAQILSNAPSAITVSTTAPFGYRFRYRTTGNTWYRTQ